MKLLILRSNLLEAMGIIEKAVPSNPSLPILEDIHIEASITRLTLSSTNLEMGIQCASAGKVVEEGSATVPYKVLSDVVKNLNAEKVSLESQEGRILVVTDNYEASLQSHDVKEFPIIPGVESEEQSLEIESALLSECISSVITATQYSEIRPEISGVYLSVTRDRVVFVATDGFRLAERSLDASSVKKSPDCVASCIIPLKTASEILRIISGLKSGMIRIVIESHQIHFIWDACRIVSRVVDGRYPEYSAIIPKEFTTTVKVNRQECHDAIRLVSALSGKGHDITIKTRSSEKQLELFSSDQARGENKYRVGAIVSGDEFSIVFNWRYISDGLKVFKVEDLELCFSSHGADRPGPALFRSDRERNLIYIAMPIRN